MLDFYAVLHAKPCERFPEKSLCINLGGLIKYRRVEIESTVAYSYLTGWPITSSCRRQMRSLSVLGEDWAVLPTAQSVGPESSSRRQWAPGWWSAGCRPTARWWCWTRDWGDEWPSSAKEPHAHQPARNYIWGRRGLTRSQVMWELH